jgi:cytochrome c oxidase cbb3-type subunit 3
MSMGWSWYVIVLVLFNIAGCVWLLWWTARRRPGDPKPTDTSHIWDDDLTEYNKPLPKWWINLFYITIVFSLGYIVWYGGMGGVKGYGGWSSAKEHAADKRAQDAKLNRAFAKFQGQPIDVIARDPQAVAIGHSIFANTCSGCHGSSARGAIGYPNLTDDVWHWGGTPEAVLQSVLEGREGVMPEWGKVLTGMGGENAVDYVASYVRAMPDAKGLHNNYMAAQGKPLYEGLCVACHGADGKGNAAMGAPDLTDDYWLYGGDRTQIAQSIATGRHGVMPAHRQLLGETRSRLVAAYVWSLSKAEPKVAAR